MKYLIGIGTYSATDDSIGLRVAEAIAERGLDRGFQSIDLAGNLLDLVHYLEDASEGVLVVDAARMGTRVGEWAFFTPAEVGSEKQLARRSTHEGDLLQALELADSLGVDAPTVTIMGIEPEQTGPGMALSAALEGRFEEYVEAAIQFMEKVPK